MAQCRRTASAPIGRAAAGIGGRLHRHGSSRHESIDSIRFVTIFNAFKGHGTMLIRRTTIEDWERLKQVRLAALLDAPTAFGVTHASAAAYSDAQWRERASSANGSEFYLAFIDDVAVGMAAAAMSEARELNLIAMWVQPDYRGTGAAAGLIDAIKARALAQGHAGIVLDVAPENERATAFYRKQGFAFLPEWEALASHPEIMLQKMAWRAPK
jgi:ribosomal protein S18 acetylase RimI-like enzyme